MKRRERAAAASERHCSEHDGARERTRRRPRRDRNAVARARPSPNPAQVGARETHKMPPGLSSKKEPEKKKAPPAPEKAGPALPGHS